MRKIRPYKYPQDKTAIKALLLESVKPKTDDFVIFTILAVSAYSVLVTWDEYTFEEFFDKFTFLDGSPCGVEEEEE